MGARENVLEGPTDRDEIFVDAAAGSSSYRLGARENVLEGLTDREFEYF